MTARVSARLRGLAARASAVRRRTAAQAAARFPAAALWMRVGLGTLRRFGAVDGGVYAGYIAFSFLLAMFPFALVAAGVLADFVGEALARRLILAAIELLPSAIAERIEAMVLDVLDNRAVGALTVSFLTGLWGASNMVTALRTGLNRVYGAADRRPYLLRRLIGMAAVLAMISGFFILLAAVVVEPVLERAAAALIGGEAPAEIARDALRFLVFAPAFFLLLLLTHRTLPCRTPEGPLWPGALFSTVGQIAGAGAFAFYLKYLADYAAVYGALGGVAATMAFFYLSSAVFILGAALNAELRDRRRPIHGSSTGRSPKAGVDSPCP